MERLTERDEYGNADIVGVDSGELQLNLEFEEFNLVTGALNRLADYEDLNLTADEVRDNANAFAKDRAYFFEEKEKMQEEIKELKQERDYWKREALKWANELGEQKLEMGSNGHLCNKEGRR